MKDSSNPLLVQDRGNAKHNSHAAASKQRSNIHGLANGVQNGRAETSTLKNQSDIIDHSNHTDQLLQLQSMADNYALEQSYNAQSSVSSRLKSAGDSNDLVVQRMTMTIYKPGTKNDAVLDMEKDGLAGAYNSTDRTVTLTDESIAELTGTSTLAAVGAETLIINAHGSGGTLAGRSASQFAQLLIDVGALNYAEIHIYGCQAGMALFDFGLDVSRILKTSIWAPKGNITFDTGKGEYMVRKLTYDAEQEKWVPDGEKIFDKDDAWWYFENGRPIKQGTPETPGSFPVDEQSDDYEDWSKFITVEETGSDK